MIIYKITVLTVVKSKSKNRPHPLLFFVSAGGYTNKGFYCNNDIKTRKKIRESKNKKARKQATNEMYYLIS